MRKFLALCLIFFSFVNVSIILAHEQSVARIKITESKGAQNEIYNYHLFWQVSLKDLNRVQNLDVNHDDTIKWLEIKQNRKVLEEIAMSSIQIKNQYNDCSIRLNRIEPINLFNGYAMNLELSISCLSKMEGVGYRFLNGLDSLHVAEIDIELLEFKIKRLFTSKNYSIRLSPDSSLSQQQTGFYDFIVQGITHILIGIDHLLFLIILMFSALSASYEKNNKILSKKLFKNVTIYVTAFTLAHTITLITASLNWLVLPSWLVESIIAASVALGAFKLLANKDVVNTATVFNFGLIHGLGFASVLADLTGNISENLVLLLGFNLGVEIGQILFLTGIMAILFIALKGISFDRLKLIASLPILVIATLWTVERVFGFKFIPF